MRLRKVLVDYNGLKGSVSMSHLVLILRRPKMIYSTILTFGHLTQLPFEKPSSKVKVTCSFNKVLAMAVMFGSNTFAFGGFPFEISQS